MKNEKLNVNIKPVGFLDLLAFKKLIPSRKKRIARAPSTPVDAAPPVNELADRLHPKVQYLEVCEITQETPDIKTFRLIPDASSGSEELAIFRPGQYLSFSFEIEGASVTRPYSLSSSPSEALSGYYEVTVKRNDGGFVSNYIWESWRVGSKVQCGDPQGHFYYNALRDSRKIAGIAGGCGITPFRSMAKAIADGTIDADLTIFFGCRTINDVVFDKEFKQLEEASNGRIKVIHILSDEKYDSCEHGFITADLIRKYVDPDIRSFFISGPQAMYEFVRGELKKLNVRDKFIRWELFGEIKNAEEAAGFPKEKAGNLFSMTVHMGSAVQVIPASSGESLLVAMERAGMNPPSVCRSGACGYCRSLLVKGDVFIPENETGRRLADKQFGYIHPCSSFPISDLEIIIPRKK